MTNPFILPVFQNTFYKTEEWLAEVMNLLDWDDPKRACKALRAVLHTLRDRLTVEDRQVVSGSCLTEES